MRITREEAQLLMEAVQSRALELAALANHRALSMDEKRRLRLAVEEYDPLERKLRLAHAALVRREAADGEAQLTD